MTKKELIEKLRQARLNRDVEEAEQLAKQLPEIPPLREGETIAIAFPKRPGAKEPQSTDPDTNDQTQTSGEA
jgi:hypothetical protein